MTRSGSGSLASKLPQIFLPLFGHISARLAGCKNHVFAFVKKVGIGTFSSDQNIRM
jgi:hypothetical protein